MPQLQEVCILFHYMNSWALAFDVLSWSLIFNISGSNKHCVFQHNISALLDLSLLKVSIISSTVWYTPLQSFCILSRGCTLLYLITYTSRISSCHLQPLLGILEYVSTFTSVLILPCFLSALAGHNLVRIER